MIKDFNNKRFQSNFVFAAPAIPYILGGLGAGSVIAANSEQIGDATQDAINYLNTAFNHAKMAVTAGLYEGSMKGRPTYGDNENLTISYSAPTDAIPYYTPWNLQQAWDDFKSRRSESSTTEPVITGGPEPENDPEEEPEENDKPKDKKPEEKPKNKEPKEEKSFYQNLISPLRWYGKQLKNNPWTTIGGTYLAGKAVNNYGPAIWDWATTWNEPQSGSLTTRIGITTNSNADKGSEADKPEVDNSQKVDSTVISSNDSVYSFLDNFPK